MKTTEIVAGQSYSNGKKGRHRSVRRVLDFGPQYKLYASQAEERCLCYAIVEGRREAYDRGRTPDGLQIRHGTVASFAAWAKEKVEAPPRLDAPPTAR